MLYTCNLHNIVQQLYFNCTKNKQILGLKIFSMVSSNKLNVMKKKFVLIKNCEDFPGGLVARNPPASVGYTSSIPGLGGSTCLRATETVFTTTEPELQSLRVPAREATATRRPCAAMKRSSLLAATRENPLQQRRPRAAKISK